MTASCPVHHHQHRRCNGCYNSAESWTRRKRNPCKRSEKGKPTTKAGCRGRQGSCFCRLYLIGALASHFNVEPRRQDATTDIWTGDFSGGIDRTSWSIKDMSREENATRIHPWSRDPWSRGAVDKSQFLRNNTTAHGPCFVSTPMSGGITTSPTGHGPH